MIEGTAKTLTLVGDEDGCALWRIFLPVTRMQQQGYPWIDWGKRDDPRLGYAAHKYDAIILPRLHWPKAEQDKARLWFNALHNAGIAVIYEIDDDLFSDDFVKRLVEIHDKELSKALEIRQNILDTISLVDGVTVSNPRLSAMIGAFTNKPVRMVPNFIDVDWFLHVQKQGKREVRGLTIGWAGGKRPDQDVEMMAEAWGRIAQRYPFVTFVIMGYLPEVITKFVPSDRIYVIPWMGISTYPQGLKNIDIGCCPLADTQFNRCKTPIKAMEYALSGAPVVASPVVYSQILEAGEDSFIVDSTDGWEEALSHLVENYKMRKFLRKALLHKIKTKHALENNVWRWEEAWRSIIIDFRSRQSTRILVPSEVNYGL